MKKQEQNTKETVSMLVYGYLVILFACLPLYMQNKLVMIGNDKIFVSYCGEDYARDSFPTKILVFDLEGNYLKTLETGYKISDCCYDSFNNRIILSLNDVVQFAYLDIDGII